MPTSFSRLQAHLGSSFESNFAKRKNALLLMFNVYFTYGQRVTWSTIDKFSKVRSQRPSAPRLCADQVAKLQLECETQHLCAVLSSALLLLTVVLTWFAVRIC